jgi:hypothetical protein
MPRSPTRTAVAPPPAGHNQPPRVPTAPEVASLLQSSCAALQTRRNEILEGIARFEAKYPVIPDDDIQGRATDFAGRTGAIAKWLQEAEKLRETEKRPYLDGGATVDGYFKTLVADVNEGRKTIIGRMNAYAEAREQAERQRLAAEATAAAEAAKQAEAAALATMEPEAFEEASVVAQVAEQAAARALAPAAELSRVHGVQSTGSSSLRSTWKFDEANSDLMELVKAVADGRAPLRYLQFHTTNIGFAIRSERVREIPGCAIKEDRSV